MAPTSTQRHVKTTGWLSWAMLAALAGVVAVQLVFARWAYLAYKHGEVRCAPAHPNCLSLHLYGPPLFDMPAWGHVIAWFVVDLALLLLGLWRLARLVGGEGGPCDGPRPPQRWRWRSACPSATGGRSPTRAVLTCPARRCTSTGRFWRIATAWSHG